MIDLHTHSTFSDGELIPAELVRRARVAGYKAIGITDHADATNMKMILDNIGPFAREHGHFFDITVLAGVELTHTPPSLITTLVAQARALGAQLVVMHGETIVEPVASGTNLAAIEAGVDILAHPGLITEEEVKLAAEKGVCLEITTRGGHSYTNGHVLSLARKHGAKLVIDNDAHAPKDLVGAELRKGIALGCGMTAAEYDQARQNSWEIVQRAMR
ncbi:histidinol phosphate phosphatase domain-containing protein [Salidesulfovibrio onnuriiensis]|uniref:histidinol phosphate phosphatase domain-containing protein n=1 Tax=Salidesulfovibrio onnuriiensis TaxID=2583823 RepID=UPI0011CB3DB7|nr:histidinol phosphate phosphatase domain-containing protein [Salidesulfovibrio onnuriiensis]